MQMLGAGISMPLYQTQSGNGAIRRVIVSGYTTSELHNGLIDLLMCNNYQARVASWISVVSLNIAGRHFGTNFLEDPAEFQYGDQLLYWQLRGVLWE